MANLQVGFADNVSKVQALTIDANVLYEEHPKVHNKSKEKSISTARKCYNCDQVRHFTRECKFRQKVAGLTLSANSQADVKSKNSKGERRKPSVCIVEWDLAKLYNPTCSDRLLANLQSNWEEPYKVITRITDSAYRIQRHPKSSDCSRRTILSGGQYYENATYDDLSFL